MRWDISGVCSALLILGACSQPPPASSDTSSAEPAATNSADASDSSAPIADNGPTPNYADRKGDVYYYIAKVSDDDEAHGRAAGDAFGFRFLGKNADGEYGVAAVNGYGMPMAIARCTNPCAVVHLSDGSSIGYNPETIIGEALSDAMNGFLQGPPPPPIPTPLPTDSAPAGNSPVVEASRAALDASQVYQPATNVSEARVLPRAGLCSMTTVSDLGPVSHGNGLVIKFANGGREIDRSDHPESIPWRAGDPVRLCVMSVPTRCTAGDGAEVRYRAQDLRAGGAWNGGDGGLACGSD